jgi:hypothetical protein
MSITPEIWFGIGAVLLLLGIIYGWSRYATRDRSRDGLTEIATRRLYDTETRDDAAELPAPDELAEERERERSTAR